MKVYNVNGLQPIRDFYEPGKKRSEPVRQQPGDRVEISPEAKKHALAQPLLDIVREYLSKIQPVRDENVAEAKQRVDNGYNLDRQMLETVAENILNDFSL